MLSIQATYQQEIKEKFYFHLDPFMLQVYFFKIVYLFFFSIP